MRNIRQQLSYMSLGSIIATSLLLPTATASANEAVANVADDIIITARRRSESVQTVPISVTAMSADDMAERNISNLNDLTNSTPGVAITTMAGGTMSNIYIRGQAPANTTNDLNVEANVGIFIDDIYQTSRNTVDIISVLDVGQIEIAKGPQSALFGRSTFAGAMSISTRPPSDVLEANVQATVGVDEDYRLRGSISLPLSDKLSVRVGGGYVTYDGYSKNLADPDDKLGGTEKYAFTGSIEYRPTEELTARLSGFVSHSKTELTPVYLPSITTFNCGNVNAATGLPTLYCGELQAQRDSDLSTGIPDTEAKARQISLNINWVRDGISFTSITGFTGAENVTYNDTDATSEGVLFGVCDTNCSPFALNAYDGLTRMNVITQSRERVRTFSQEFRVQSDSPSPFQWMLGGNYFSSDIPLAGTGLAADATGLGPNDRMIQVTPIGTVPTTGLGAYDFTANPYYTLDPNQAVFGSYTKASTKTFSIFGSLGYRFGNLRVAAEGRYNIDRKRAQIFSVNNAMSQPWLYQPINGAEVPEDGVFPVVGPKFARTHESFTPRFTIDYQATPDIFLYASAAKGVRSGGFNTTSPVSTTGILASEVSYDEEENWTYEGGFKSNLFNRSLLFNASVFHTHWTNAQVSAFTNNPTAVNPPRIVRNAGDIKTTGVEVTAVASLGDMFKVGGSVIYADPKFQAGAYDGSSVAQCITAGGVAAEGCPPAITVQTPSGPMVVNSIEGLRPQRSVKLQWNAHASADIPLNDSWRLFARVDVNHTGDVPMNLLNTVYFGERTLTNARLAVESDQYSIALWVNNAFDVNYVMNSIAQPRAGLPFAFFVPEVYRGEGRRFGLTVGAKF